MAFANLYIMKQLLIASILLSRLLACENVTGVFNNAGSDSAKIENTTIVTVPVRDMSINSENSYSDLFLDSTVIEQYIKDKNFNDSAAQNIRYFYNARNYQFAWFNSDGFTEQGRGFWSLYDYANDLGERGSLQDKNLDRRMDTLAEIDTLYVHASDSLFITTELALTNQFLQYAGKAKNENAAFADPYHFVPSKKLDVMQWADSVLTKQNNDTSLSGKPYNLLKDQLARYYDVAQKGGWQPIPVGVKNLKKGKSSPVVVAIKKRLLLTGDMTGSDTSQVYNDSAIVAIKSYKLSHGFDSTERISDSLIHDLNISVTERMQQILINMNRMQWMPAENKNQMIEVNIPEFMLSVYEGGSKAFDMKVIVGKEGAHTMMFSGDLNQVVFSPYWNIPESIVRDEIMPAIQKDPNYLKKHNMEIVKKNDSIPTIRQLPGDENSLGKAKFLFPNSYDIFFHDTPAKELFQKNQRAFSHGCIRLHDAQKMAAYLLRDDPSWTPEKIKVAMNSKKEQYVKLKNSVPVMINYFTTWVDENGQINFRNDVYGHDKKTASRLFATNTSIPDNKSDYDSKNKKPERADSVKIKA